MSEHVLFGQGEGGWPSALALAEGEGHCTQGVDSLCDLTEVHSAALGFGV